MALTDKLTAIADAIRSKTGKTDKISLGDMPSEIESISGGSDLTLTSTQLMRLMLTYGGPVSHITDGLISSVLLDDNNTWNNCWYVSTKSTDYLRDEANKASGFRNLSGKKIIFIPFCGFRNYLKRAGILTTTDSVEGTDWEGVVGYQANDYIEKTVLTTPKGHTFYYYTWGYAWSLDQNNNLSVFDSAESKWVQYLTASWASNLFYMQSSYNVQTTSLLRFGILADYILFDER